MFTLFLGLVVSFILTRTARSRHEALWSTKKTVNMVAYCAQLRAHERMLNVNLGLVCRRGLYKAYVVPPCRDTGDKAPVVLPILLGNSTLSSCWEPNEEISSLSQTASTSAT